MSELFSIVKEYYLENGGVVNGAIFLCAVLSLSQGLERFGYYHSLERRLKKQKLSDVERFIVQTQLSRGLQSMVSWISAAPLLGLLGTVIGMIRTFETITLYGNGNPVFLTKGISVALHTTQAGLLVSIPILLFYSLLVQQRNRLSALIIGGGSL